MTWRPGVTTGSTLTFCNNEVYLIGGLGSGMNEGIAVMQHSKWVWTQIKDLT